MAPLELEPYQAKMVAAATGSTVTALTMTPFDVIKTRLQSQRPTKAPLLFPNPPPQTCCQPASVGCVRQMSSLARQAASDVVCIWDHGRMRTERVNGFWDAGRHVIRAEGLRGLWKGSGTTLVIGVPSSSCYMLTYDHLLRNVIPAISPSPLLTPLLSGIISRAALSTLASPLELIRTNLQSTPLHPSTPHTLRSVLSSLSTLVSNQGLFSLWRGLGPTLWRDVPFSGIYWASYESTKALLTRQFGLLSPDAKVAFLSGAISGTTAALITQPFDMLKTRRQALSMDSTIGGGGGVKRGSIYIMKEILRAEGLRSVYAGITPRIAKIAPACGIMIACYEGVGRYLAKKPPATTS